MVDKEAQLPNKFKLTCWLGVQQCCLTLSVTIWMKWDTMVRNPGGTHCWHRQTDWSLSKLTWGSQHPMDKWDQNRAFGKANHWTIYRKQNGLQRKEHGPWYQTWWRFRHIWGCFWHWMPWLCVWHYAIWRPSKLGFQRSWVFPGQMTQNILQKALGNVLRQSAGKFWGSQQWVQV